ncbi:MAG: transglycosylase SLT domain-containing protein [Shewanella xiamenensis]|jgi:hypothetical protein|uniref:Transglycosylase SLT domain-containing protein n=1 Tax=Shewanella xiamenensis TaxID=332186 RepID=A0AAE4TQQ1_9GAMM|nr:MULTISPECIES: transglycosylase SLT domain-containing protein [Shewanella]MCD8552101.1 transglycosylase SLT domain-containing protein [Shewanella xiamenensis]MCD8560389.1 transglycosylase SLT domain-containing protein [Shewanella xiamenensis]MDH0451109.1 transglycosylase SLT domain-containing protein [Shewanella sp. GD04112]MDV5393278.1 transglycosylase SLT domain-containing protein [Shewanella xiamenensis]
MFKRLITALVLSLSFNSEAAATIPSGFVRIGASCGVPPVALYAVALTETETGLRNGDSSVWPHSINWNGRSYHFKNRKDTYIFAQNLIAQGHTLFDVGIMQVNWRWHKDRVSSLWELTDTETNIRTACEIMGEGYQARRNWVSAAGYYHAPNNATNANKYMKKFNAKLNRLLKQQDLSK